MESGDCDSGEETGGRIEGSWILNALGRWSIWWRMCWVQSDEGMGGDWRLQKMLCES